MKKKETTSEKKITFCIGTIITGDSEVIENLDLIEQYITTKLDELLKELNKTKRFKSMKSVEFYLENPVQKTVR
jgi:hypothetical protein